ncbi:hypothetical protein [Hoyosella altamirensis]|uniref:Uncharacterized protein n=1 Tax=Hoyosella altamirensis TaxID=616997 RepID=A0A839RH52_9ACTN|nr:hypothetical protein [Hoyosella altamirensis]MBB3035568.1 hypothetical protein [Hoyosella altamirensis]
MTAYLMFKHLDVCYRFANETVESLEAHVADWMSRGLVIRMPTVINGQARSALIINLAATQFAVIVEEAPEDRETEAGRRDQGRRLQDAEVLEQGGWRPLEAL